MRKELEGVRKEIVDHKAHLGRALNNLKEPGLGPEETLEALLARCQQLVADIKDDARQREDLEGRIDELEKELVQARRMEVMAAGSCRSGKKPGPRP